MIVLIRFSTNPFEKAMIKTPANTPSVTAIITTVLLNLFRHTFFQDKDQSIISEL
jgi:hypothetical protein